jgi:hypothetical protein
MEWLRRELSNAEEGRIGIFPSWGVLYASVIIYTVVITVLLYVFTILLDHGAR